MGNVTAGSVNVCRHPDTVFLPRRFAARYPRYMDNAASPTPGTSVAYLAPRRRSAYLRIGASDRLFLQRVNWTTRLESNVGSCPRLTHPGFRLDSRACARPPSLTCNRMGNGSCHLSPSREGRTASSPVGGVAPRDSRPPAPRMPAGGLPRRHDGPPAARRWEAHRRRSRRARWPPVDPSCWRGSRKA